MKREEVLKIAKPILFNTEMVQAVQNRTKTVTRRVIKQKFKNTVIEIKGGTAFESNGSPMKAEIIPPFRVGDILYVRETWQYAYDLDENEQAIEGTGHYIYAADGEPYNVWIDDHGDRRDHIIWRPSIHMPKEAARIFLRVKSIKPEWLQEITNEQAIAEGIDPKNNTLSARHIFKVDLWNSTIKKSELDLYGWKANPGVWVIEFEKVVIDNG